MNLTTIEIIRTKIKSVCFIRLRIENKRVSCW